MKIAAGHVATDAVDAGAGPSPENLAGVPSRVGPSWGSRLVGALLASALSGALLGCVPSRDIADPTLETATSTPAAVPEPSPETLLAVGDIASCSSSGDERVADLAKAIPGTIATLGDTVYQSGSAREFAECFDPAWGPLKPRIRPAVGNHEYLTAGASPYFEYFGGSAGDPAEGYYGYDLGAWHVVVLNSNCRAVGGCGAGSPQVRWLHADLAAHASTCTLVYWHHPRFSSGEQGSYQSMQAIWSVLYDYGVEVALAGHDHNYERFAPLDANGAVDEAAGIRSFVVGTGGKNHYPVTGRLTGSEVINSDTYGLLRMTLRADGYDWEFVHEPGATFTDSGHGSCHPARSAEHRTARFHPGRSPGSLLQISRLFALLRNRHGEGDFAGASKHRDQATWPLSGLPDLPAQARIGWITIGTTLRDSPSGVDRPGARKDPSSASPNPTRA